ncbi:MAG: competence protein TfoX [Rhizobiaceae bacterium]|nr:competence protein TfoX [Rhizobiaceae bacterium]
MDKDFLSELFAPFGDVTIRKMFGGVGIFYRGLNFAGIMDGQLRLKADEQTIADFVAEGMTPWEYKRNNGKAVTMSYWSVPERLLDDPEEFKPWAQKAFEAACRADQAKPLKQRKLKEF